MSELGNSIKAEQLIVFSDNNLIVACKEPGLPTVPLKKNINQDCLLNRLSKIYPELKDSYSEKYWEGSAVHRLDNATSGLVLFARNKEFYHYLIKLQNEDRIIKTYCALCDCTLTDETHISEVLSAGYIESYFKSYGRKGMYVKPVFDVKKADCDRMYRTDYEAKLSDGYCFTCRITRGFRHQIRTHLSYLGFPIKGDNLYNPLLNKDNVYKPIQLMLSCTEISVPDPDKKNSDMTFKLHQ